MFRMKPGSIGDMPPRTFLSPEFSAFTAFEARFTMVAKTRHSGSISKFQCERLFGSFQNITESTMGRRLAPADVYLFFGMLDDLETRAAQHGFRARAIRNPPVRRIVRI